MEGSRYYMELTLSLTVIFVFILWSFSYLIPKPEVNSNSKSEFITDRYKVDTLYYLLVDGYKYDSKVYLSPDTYKLMKQTSKANGLNFEGPGYFLVLDSKDTIRVPYSKYHNCTIGDKY